MAAPQDGERRPSRSRRSFTSDESGSDSEVEWTGTTSPVVRHTKRKDMEILKEEEEHEELLADVGRETTGPVKRLLDSGQRFLRSRRKEKANARGPNKLVQGSQQPGESGVMYELESGSGFPKASFDSADSDQDRLDAVYASEAVCNPLLHPIYPCGYLIQAADLSQVRKKSKIKIALFATGLVGLFLLLLLQAYRATVAKKHAPVRHHSDQELANWPLTTVLISLDGFRADFLNRGLTPSLNSFIDQGVSPRYILPSFPSVTFPNHYTMVTGLYPESHGIVGNSFWDPELQDNFYYTDPTKSLQAKWWQAEPIWVTAEKQGVKVAVHMWPGSEVDLPGVGPHYVDKYKGDEKLSRKLDRIMHFLDIPGPQASDYNPKTPRPQLIAAYVPIVDSDGHKWGPNSTEIRKTIHEVDDMIAGILTGIEERNLSSVVNVVVVSDHGMATTDVTRLIQLEDLVNTDLVEHTDGWPLFGLRFKNSVDDAHLHKIYEEIHGLAAERGSFEVHLRGDMPQRYHFNQSDRIAPLWIIPNAGWAVVTKDDFDVAKGLRNGDVYHPRGLHGYDHEHPLMRAIFAARGPSFPHSPGSRVEVFRKSFDD